MYHLEPLSERHAQEICKWRYEPPYDLYQFGSWENMQSGGLEFGDPKIREEQYFAVVDQSGELCGFAQLFPMEGLTRIGLGMRPDLCGRGMGGEFVRAVTAEAQQKTPANSIDLEVLAWNVRAYKVYERCGFQYEQSYDKMTPTGEQTFHCMVYHPELKG